MTNIRLSSFILLFTLYACAEQAPENVATVYHAIAEVDHTDTIQESINEEHNKVVDTLEIGEYYLLVYRTDTLFKKVRHRPVSFETYAEEILLDTSLTVTRDGDTLNFSLANNNAFRLADVNYQDGLEVESVNYYYVNDLDNYWLIDAICYEYNYTVHVNRVNGDTINSIAPGVISPSRELMLCSNIDLESGFTWNGCELFQLKKGRSIKLGFAEIPDWGLTNLKWITDTRLTATRVDVTENYEYMLSEVALEIVKK